MEPIVGFVARVSRCFLPKALPAKLLLLRPVNHEIDLQLEPGSKPPSRAPYRLSQPQLNELQAQLSTLLEKGLIETSKSPNSAQYSW